MSQRTAARRGELHEVRQCHRFGDRWRLIGAGAGNSRRAAVRGVRRVAEPGHRSSGTQWRTLPAACRPRQGARSVVGARFPAAQPPCRGSGFSAECRRVLIFVVHRSNDRCLPGLVAQWESVRLTRGRSLVRYQPGPLIKRQFRGLISPSAGSARKSHPADIRPNDPGDPDE
jgi:hypothetical protein